MALQTTLGVLVSSTGVGGPAGATLHLQPAGSIGQPLVAGHLGIVTDLTLSYRLQQQAAGRQRAHENIVGAGNAIRHEGTLADIRRMHSRQCLFQHRRRLRPGSRFIPWLLRRVTPLKATAWIVVAPGGQRQPSLRVYRSGIGLGICGLNRAAGAGDQKTHMSAADVPPAPAYRPPTRQAGTAINRW